MLKPLILTTCLAVALSQNLTANTYPRPLQILLEGVEDSKERARLIRVYQRPITEEDKKLVKEAREKAAQERGGTKNQENDNKKKSSKKKKNKRK